MMVLFHFTATVIVMSYYVRVETEICEWSRPGQNVVNKCFFVMLKCYECEWGYIPWAHSITEISVCVHFGAFIV